ncbi:hypothetical protein B0H11DRAFT_1902563 [Mycena galericulata]|nr:hypothetical protein B0H11DRAFT_1925698 [Mycena galericulata]KAJ7508245.1 hypothetical protein B0H11DRAFT_1902563 [Mycena galericulata]
MPVQYYADRLRERARGKEEELRRRERRDVQDSVDDASAIATQLNVVPVKLSPSLYSILVNLWVNPKIASPSPATRGRQRNEDGPRGRGPMNKNGLEPASGVLELESAQYGGSAEDRGSRRMREQCRPGVIAPAIASVASGGDGDVRKAVDDACGGRGEHLGEGTEGMGEKGSRDEVSISRMPNAVNPASPTTRERQLRLYSQPTEKRIHEFNATGGAQSNNPEFRLGTTRTGYMN